MNKEVTTNVCENILYLMEINNIKYIKSMEDALGLSKGYLSRCLNNPSKRLSVDALDNISSYFDVSVKKLMYHDLRDENYGKTFEDDFEYY